MTDFLFSAHLWNETGNVKTDKSIIIHCDVLYNYLLSSSVWQNILSIFGTIWNNFRIVSSSFCFSLKWLSNICLAEGNCCTLMPVTNADNICFVLWSSLYRLFPPLLLITLDYKGFCYHYLQHLRYQGQQAGWGRQESVVQQPGP